MGIFEKGRDTFVRMYLFFCEHILNALSPGLPVSIILTSLFFSSSFVSLKENNYFTSHVHRRNVPFTKMSLQGKYFPLSMVVLKMRSVSPKYYTVVKNVTFTLDAFEGKFSEENLYSSCFRSTFTIRYREMDREVWLTVVRFISEEVFGSNKALWFSPSGSKLAFGYFDDSHTPIITIPFYGYPGSLTFQYTSTISIHYPKVSNHERSSLRSSFYLKKEKKKRIAL